MGLKEWKPKMVTIPKPHNDVHQQRTVTHFALTLQNDKSKAEAEERKKERAKTAQQWESYEQCSQKFKPDFSVLSFLSQE